MHGSDDGGHEEDFAAIIVDDVGELVGNQKKDDNDGLEIEMYDRRQSQVQVGAVYWEIDAVLGIIDDRDHEYTRNEDNLDHNYLKAK